MSSQCAAPRAVTLVPCACGQKTTSFPFGLSTRRSSEKTLVSWDPIEVLDDAQVVGAVESAVGERQVHDVRVPNLLGFGVAAPIEVERRRRDVDRRDPDLLVQVGVDRAAPAARVQEARARLELAGDGRLEPRFEDRIAIKRGGEVVHGRRLGGLGVPVLVPVLRIDERRIENHRLSARPETTRVRLVLNKQRHQRRDAPPHLIDRHLRAAVRTGRQRNGDLRDGQAVALEHQHALEEERVAVRLNQVEEIAPNRRQVVERGKPRSRPGRSRACSW